VEQRDQSTGTDKKYFSRPNRSSMGSSLNQTRKVIPQKVDIHFTSSDTLSAVQKKCIEKFQLAEVNDL
jgi:hypothetical protein